MNVIYNIKVYTTWEIENCNYHSTFLNWVVLVIFGANRSTFGTHVVEVHLEETLSQIFNLGPSFYFMKARKLSGKNQ